MYWKYILKGQKNMLWIHCKAGGWAGRQRHETQNIRQNMVVHEVSTLQQAGSWFEPAGLFFMWRNVLLPQSQELYIGSHGYSKLPVNVNVNDWLCFCVSPAIDCTPPLMQSQVYMFQPQKHPGLGLSSGLISKYIAIVNILTYFTNNIFLYPVLCLSKNTLYKYIFLYG